MAYQTMDVQIKGGWFKDAWDKTSKEIQKGLEFIKMESTLSFVAPKS